VDDAGLADASHADSGATDTHVADTGTTGTSDTGAGDTGASHDTGAGDTGTVGADAGACVCGDRVCRAGCELATTCELDCGELIFDTDDARRTTTTGDWAIGDWKAECSPAQAMQGLSASCFGLFCGAHAALCAADDTAHDVHSFCHVLDFSSSDARGTTSTGDWAPGLSKGECGVDEYVSGYARDPSGRVSKILCCSGSGLHHAGCAAEGLFSGDARESMVEGDWSPSFHKAECAPGRYVAGVASSELDGVRAILCCSP
jgi:hypothetical protein